MEARKAAKAAERERDAATLRAEQNIVIDCAFEDMMAPNQSRSLVSQLARRRSPPARAVRPRSRRLQPAGGGLLRQAALTRTNPRSLQAYCYAANRRAAVPARLTFAGLGPIVSSGLGKLTGIETWPARPR